MAAKYGTRSCRPVASHPGGGGGSELGWVEHYTGHHGMVGLSISWQKQGV